MRFEATKQRMVGFQSETSFTCPIRAYGGLI